jgi:UDP-N-acetylmuramoylalanine--D-glutamate ligase
VVLIAGGVDKGNDYSQIEELVRNKVKGLIVLGKSFEKLKDYFSGIVPQIYTTQDIQDAVNKEKSGLSPGMLFCSHRHVPVLIYSKTTKTAGEKFKAAVRNLVKH